MPHLWAHLVPLPGILRCTLNVSCQTTPCSLARRCTYSRSSEDPLFHQQTEQESQGPHLRFSGNHLRFSGNHLVYPGLPRAHLVPLPGILRCTLNSSRQTTPCSLARCCTCPRSTGDPLPSRQTVPTPWAHLVPLPGILRCTLNSSRQTTPCSLARCCTCPRSTGDPLPSRQTVQVR